MCRWLLIGLVGMLLASGARAENTIVLRASARINAGASLTIGDIAVVTGNAALESLRIAADTQENRRLVIGIHEVRRVLESHGYGPADATVRGESCTVIVRSPKMTAKPEALNSAPNTHQQIRTGLTVRDHVRATIERAVGQADGTLRLRFDPEDTEALDRVTTGLTVDVHTSGLGRRTPARVTLYSPDGAIEVLRVRVSVQILRQVARINRALTRGATVTPSDFAVSNEWLAPDEPHLEPAVAVGQRLRRAVDTGDRLTSASVQPPIVIERGDIVMLHVVTGTVVLRQESRALESGRIGQRIRIEPISGGRAVQAAIEGPGRAVIVTAPRLQVEDR